MACCTRGSNGSYTFRGPKGNSHQLVRENRYQLSVLINACGVLVSPHSHPINLHLLRKHSAAIWGADKVSANRNVEDDEERALKLRRAIDSARNVRFRVLNPIDIPLDRSRSARDRKRMKARRK